METSKQIREGEEIQAIEEEESEAESKEDDPTFITLDVRELLMIRRVLYAKEFPPEPNQREQIFHT